MSDDGYLDGTANQKTNWSVIASFTANLFSFASKLLWILVVAVILTVLVRSVTDHKTVISSISVPKCLSDSGYTSDVAAERLHDVMLTLANSANTQKKNPDVVLHGEVPDIVVPTVGLSVDAITTTIRTLFNIPGSHNITGEIVESDKLLWLRLRLDGNELYHNKSGVAPNKPDDLFGEAAVTPIFEIIEPYFVAALSKTHQTNPEDELEVVDKYIDTRQDSDEDVPWLYNLKGKIFEELNDSEHAVSAYIKAYTLNPDFATPHNNLGRLFGDQNDTDRAIAEYQMAQAIDPHNAFSHNGLGKILQKEGSTARAAEEYREAIAIDPHYAEPHSNLGIILLNEKKFDEAAAEFRKAIAFDTKFPIPHYYLGMILEIQGNANGALTHYREAIKLDPDHLPGAQKKLDTLWQQYSYW